MEKDKEFYENIMKESCSLQGMYGRFYFNEYTRWPEEYQDMFIDELKKAEVGSLLDFVLFMEC